MILLHNRSMVYHSASNADSYVQISVRHIIIRGYLNLLILPDLLSLRKVPQKVSPVTYYHSHQLIVQMAYHTYVPRWHHPHQMPEQYGQYLYHLLKLHIRHKLHKMPFYVVFRLPLPHSHTTAHRLCIPDLYLYKFPKSHKQVSLSLHLLIYQEQCPATPLPYNKHIHPLL